MEVGTAATQSTHSMQKHVVALIIKCSFFSNFIYTLLLENTEDW